MKGAPSARPKSRNGGSGSARHKPKRAGPEPQRGSRCPRPRTRLETRLLDDGLGISAEVPEDGWDLFGDAQAHEAGSNRLFRPAETRLARRGRLAPRAPSRPMPEAKAGCHVDDLQGGDHLAIRHCPQSYNTRADAWRPVAGPTELRIGFSQVGAWKYPCSRDQWCGFRTTKFSLLVVR
jgi:hypothetical protein